MLKRFILHFAAPLMLAVSTQANPVYSSAFGNDFTDHWDATSKEGPGAEVQVVEATLPDGSTRMALRVDDTGNRGNSSYLTALRYFEPQSEHLNVRFRIRFRSTDRSSASTFDWRLRLLGTNETVHLRMRQRSDRNGFSHLEGLPSQYAQSAIDTIQLDEWYEVTLAVDLKEKRYSWKAKNLTPGSTQIAEVNDVPFVQGSSPTINRIAFTTITRGGAFELCDVTVTTAD